MASSIVLEKLSNRQLGYLFVVNIIILVMVCIAGGKGPRPTNNMTRITEKCNDKFMQFQRGTKPIDNSSCPEKIKSMVVDEKYVVVFYAVFPSSLYPYLTMSRWFQWMITIMQFIPAQPDERIPYTNSSPKITFKGAVFGRNSENESWKVLHDSSPDTVYHRRVDCKYDGQIIDCSDASLFELGSVHYAHYLVNVQLLNGYNDGLPRLEELDIVEIHQNAGFTKVWVAHKTVACAMLLIATVLFRRQVYKCDRNPLIITKIIQALGVVNVIFNLPLEYISLVVDAPGLRVWYDCSTGLFYAAMAVLWLLFIGEHRMDLDQRNKFSNYWKEVTAISICGCVMFLFDVIERGLQVADPFHSIWATEGGETAARTLLTISAVCAGFYFLVLLYLVVRAVVSMSRKRASLVNSGRVRELYYEGLITRFKVMIFGTMLCGLLTVVMYVLVSYNEMHKWERTEGSLEITSGFLVGMAGLWNLYVLNILLLYSPVAASNNNADVYETVEMSEVDVNAGIAGPTDALTTLTKPNTD